LEWALHKHSVIMMVGLVMALSACQQNKSVASERLAKPSPDAIAWREGNVAGALREAKETGKPILLDWGAKWCPPCTVLQTTIFKDPAFIRETKAFIPVHLDGDTPQAQQWGDRFKILGYPTLIVLKPDGSELTRIGSTASGAGVAKMLHDIRRQDVSFGQLVEQAHSNPSALSSNDWHVLAGHDWPYDYTFTTNAASRTALFRGLAAAAPDPAVARQFTILAFGFDAYHPDGQFALPSNEQQRVAEALSGILNNPRETQDRATMLIALGAPLIAALPNIDKRQDLARRLAAAMEKLAVDPALTPSDRFGAVMAEVALAKTSGPDSPKATLAKVRAYAVSTLTAIKNPLLREATIPDIAMGLSDAGDPDGGIKLLKDNIRTAQTPSIFYSYLSMISESMKKNSAAVSYARTCFETTEGATSRVQYAIVYAQTAMRLTPSDKGAIAHATNATLDALASRQVEYAGRVPHEIARLGRNLPDWAAANGGSAILSHVSDRMTAICSQKGAARQTCLGWLHSA
jgi:protein disulfide-isomerase